MVTVIYKCNIREREHCNKKTASCCPAKALYVTEESSSYVVTKSMEQQDSASGSKANKYAWLIFPKGFVPVVLTSEVVI